MCLFDDLCCIELHCIVSTKEGGVRKISFNLRTSNFNPGLMCMQLQYRCRYGTCFALNILTNYDHIWDMAGCNCNWDYLLATSLGHREERSSFHSNVHSFSSHYNSNILSIPVERSHLLGKVHIP